MKDSTRGEAISDDKANLVWNLHILSGSETIFKFINGLPQSELVIQRMVTQAVAAGTVRNEGSNSIVVIFLGKAKFPKRIWFQSYTDIYLVFPWQQIEDSKWYIYDYRIIYRYFLNQIKKGFSVQFPSLLPFLSTMFWNLFGRYSSLDLPNICTDQKKSTPRISGVPWCTYKVRYFAVFLKTCGPLHPISTGSSFRFAFDCLQYVCEEADLGVNFTCSLHD